MSEFLQNFHFLRPWFLLFLLVPLVLYLKKFKTTEQVSSWEDICDRNLLNFLLVNGSNAKKVSVKKFIYSGLIAAAIAAAGPTWKKIEIPTFSVENPNMFVLSLAQDMQLRDITPSRLERAKFMISEITEQLEQGQFGLEVYSQEPYVITPLTDDAELIKNLLPQIVPDIVPDYGDRLDRAIELAVKRFQSAEYTSGNIILFTSDVGQRFDLALDAVKKAFQSGYTVNVVDTSYDGNEKLKFLTEKGAGVYLSVKNVSAEKLINFITEASQDKIALSQNLRSTYIDFGYYLLFIPLICVLAFFRKGMLILFLCCFSVQAHAGFLLNDKQEGFKLFNQGQYEEALQKFKDSNWRGIILYKQDKLEEAAKEFENADQDESLYNKGVILTKLCKYQEALEAFTEALKLNPKNDDAAYNKQVLTELFSKAKEEPSVLDCKNDNQQQQNNNQDNNQTQQNEDNQQQDDQSQSQQDNQQNDSSNQEQNKDTQEKEQGQNQEQNEDIDNSSWQNQQEQNNSEDNSQENSSSNQQNKDSSNQDDSTPSDKDADESEGDNDNKPSPANNDQGPQNKSQNEDGEDNNGTENQQQQQDVNLSSAKEGDNNQDYDEEALAMQRRYREIPEDVGGLLREFIKKEYMKDRYNDEN